MTSEIDDPESLLAKAMTALTVQERNQALEDLHGVSDIVEDPLMIERRLEELDREIARKRTKAYDIAEACSPAYVANRDFRLMFLRVDVFDASAAARRLMNYFEHKLWLFGKDKLASDITQSDLSPEDLECLETGFFQRLAETDCTGRPVVLLYPPARKYKDPINFYRSLFYCLTTLMRSPEAKKPGRGFIGIVYNTSPTHSFDFQISLKSLQIRHSFPYRPTSNHLCTALHSRTTSLASLIVKLQPKHARVRTRIHTGSDIECQYQLKNFGINLASFPIDLSGNMDLSSHRCWLKEQREFETKQASSGLSPGQNTKDPVCGADDAGNRKHSESLTSESALLLPPKPAEELGVLLDNGGNNGSFPSDDDVASAIGIRDSPPTAESHSTRSKPVVNGYVTPQPQDVLFGRGSSLPQHLGNKRLRKFVELHAPEYESASKFERTLIAARLVQTITQLSGARFLKPVDGDRWVEVDESMAHKKVAQSFRCRRRRRCRGDRV